MYKLMQSLLLFLIGAVAIGREEFPICITSGEQEYPVVASDGTDYLVVWEDVRTGSYDIWGQRISATGDTLGQFPICKAAGEQFASAVAWGGTNYLVAWIEYSGGSHNVYGRLVSPTGDTLGPTFFIGNCGTAYFQEFPVIVWNGVNYLVVWSGNRFYPSGNIQIYGQLVSPTGDTLGEIPLGMTNWDQLSPAVASDGANYLVTWADYRTGNHDIYGRRVLSTGDTLSEFPICIASEGQWRPAVAWDGTNYLVVWDDKRNGGSTDIYGQLVSSEGDTLGQFAICKVQDFQWYPVVAWDRTNYLVVWMDSRLGLGNEDIWGQYVSLTGDTLGQFVICKAGDRQYFPAVARNGTNYLVVWEDARNYSTTRNDIYGKLIPSIGVTEQNKASVVISGLDVSPNPFTKFTSISYKIPAVSKVSLQIYDISGRLVKTLIHGTKEVGTYSINWDADGIPYGIYFLQLKTQEKIVTQKVVKVK